MPMLLLAPRYDLHCLLVEHGKRCFTCAKGNKPQFEPLGDCPLELLATTMAEVPTASRPPDKDAFLVSGLEGDRYAQ